MVSSVTWKTPARVESDGGPGWGEDRVQGAGRRGADRVSLGSGAQGKVSERMNLIPAFSKNANVIPPSVFPFPPSILALGLLYLFKSHSGKGND